MQCFKTDRGMSTETALAASAVVFRFGPDRDGLAKLSTCLPPAGVERVDLNEREERFHRGIIAAPADPTHGASQAIVGRVSYVHVRSELASPIAMNHGPSRVSNNDGVA